MYADLYTVVFVAFIAYCPNYQARRRDSEVRSAALSRTYTSAAGLAACSHPFEHVRMHQGVYVLVRVLCVQGNSCDLTRQNA